MPKYRQPPEWTQAEIDSHIRGDYELGRRSRYIRTPRGVAPLGSHADYHVRTSTDWCRAIEQARCMDRNNMVVGQGVTRFLNNVLGDTGCVPDPSTGNTDLDAELSSRWEAWSGDADLCDVAREHNLYAQARMALRAVVIDGDIFAYLFRENGDPDAGGDSEPGRVQMIEAHRVRTPNWTKQNMVHGVLLTERRVRESILVTKEEIAPERTLKINDTHRVPFRDPRGMRQLLQLYNPRRVSQTRGMSAMAPIVYPVTDHDELQLYKLIQAKVASAFAVIHNPADIPNPGTGDGVVQKGERTTETRDDGTPRILEGVAPGMEYHARPGETLTAFTPNIPNPEFFKHAHVLLTIIAINLDLPLIVLLLDPSETNFSGWRGAMDQAKRGFTWWQRWIVDQFYRPVYRWKVREWLALDAGLRDLARVEVTNAWQIRRRDGSDIDPWAHSWGAPGWPYIEPLKDAKAEDLSIDRGLTSRRRVLRSHGLDIDRVDKERIEDAEKVISLAVEAAERLNQTHKDANVTWRELIRWDVPSGVALTADVGDAGQS